MALKPGFPDIEKHTAKPVRKNTRLVAAHKPDVFLRRPENFQKLRTPDKQRDNAGAERMPEDTPAVMERSRIAPRASRKKPGGLYKKAALYAKAVLLFIRNIPRFIKNGSLPHKKASRSLRASALRPGGTQVNRYKAGSKTRIIKNKRLIYIGAAAIPAIALVIILVLTLGRNTSEAMAGASPSPSGSAMLVDVNGVLPGVPDPSASSSAAGVLPSATSDATIAPGTSETPVETPEPTESLAPTATPESTPVPTTKPEPTPKPIDLNELTKYYKVDADKYYSDYGYSSNHYDYTEDDVYMLAQVITRESGHEKTEGKIAVGNVIMNRVFCGYWGTTIQSVVSAPGQFSYDPAQVPNPGSISAARDVLKNEHWVIPQDIYFFNSGKTPGENWGKHTYYTQIGGHCFYRESIGRRHKGGDAPPALFDREYKWPQYGCKPAKRVTRIQHMLRALGYDVGQDGYFGKSTEEALIDFQGKKGLKADGVAGPTTIKALIKAYGKDKYYNDYVK